MDIPWPQTSYIILVFGPPAPVPNSKANPFSGDAKYKSGKILQFCD